MEIFDYEEWIKLLDIKDQPIIQHMRLIHKHLEFLDSLIGVVCGELIKKPLDSKTCF